MVQHIGAEAGRRLTKVVVDGVKKSFPSTVGEWRTRNLEEDRDYEIEINGEKYFIGDLAAESHFRRDMSTVSKIHQETKILFLAAIALVATDEHLIITTGLPINQHTPPIKRQLSDLLHGCYQIRINHQKPKLLNIHDIGIVAEGIGLYWDELLNDQGAIQNKWLATQSIVRTLDLGSRTINLATITYTPDGKRNYLDRESDTLDYGYLALEAAGNLDEKVYDSFCRRIIADASKLWLTYNPLKDVVLLGGGGVLTLGPFLKEHFPISLVAQDPLFGNASGFRKMGMVRWQTKK
jgi:hypothetical protein